MRHIFLILISAMLIVPAACSQEINLKFEQPGNYYFPGMLFFLDLKIKNSGPVIDDAQLFLAVNIGTEEFFFYPSWIKYPSGIDWEVIDISENQNQGMEIIPDFSWPSGTGQLENAVFIAAIMHKNELISNVATFRFGFSGEPPPLPEMVYIPPGTFTMGSPEDVHCRNSDEIQHQVTLTRGYHIMTTELTRRMWRDMAAISPRLPSDPSNTDTSPTLDHPANRMNWYLAHLFCNEMSRYYGLRPCFYRDMDLTVPMEDAEFGMFIPLFFDATANGFRLPSEAEWEYAARAGVTGIFLYDEPNYNDLSCFGCSAEYPIINLGNYAWFRCNSDFYQANPVAQKTPNLWGLYDVFGNVDEWCLDWSDYHSGDLVDPINFERYSGYIKAKRGSTVRGYALDCRLASRGNGHPGDPGWATGIRLVRNAE